MILCNFEIFNQLMGEVHWDKILNKLDVIEAMDSFYCIANKTISVSTPVKHCFSLTYPTWFSGKLISLLIKKKKKIHTKSINLVETMYNYFYREIFAEFNRTKVTLIHKYYT